ncbi:ABC transporter permease [Aeromicrobium sp.]|uniref:ABC transporter permease n=1 Tax=Aeromicrobium sp. TaxID=1871063 RepID=UPI003D6BCE8C
MTGTGIFIRTFLRRDRWMMFWWIAGGTLLYYSQAPSVDATYTSQAEFDRAATSMEQNVAFIAMTGPARALNTIGGQVAWQAMAIGAIVAGLMSMFIIGRHTRAEEESGRDELVRSAAVGRHAPIVAAFVVATLANVAMGGLITVSLLSYGLDVEGCLSIGVALTLTGLTFTGVALVAAQLTDGVRAMYGIAGAVIAVSYALRAVGDVAENGLSWLSPIGWGQAMHPFSGERWWPALLPVLATIALVGAALALFAHRDIGAGLWPSRPGPGRAGRPLLGTLGLAWRLQRGSIIGWTTGILLLGISYGSIGDDVEDLMGSSEFSEAILGAGTSITDSFYAFAILMIALIASGFTISSALRPLGEEEAARVEALLATALSRRTWLLGHVAMTVLGTIAVLVAGGAGLGLGFAMVTGDADAVWRYLGAMLPYLAPMLLLGALARLLHGVVPRVAYLAWVGLAFCVVVMFFGELLRFPAAVVDVSPFSHLALAPAEDVRWLPVLVVALVALVLSVVGQAAFRRRDVITT